MFIIAQKDESEFRGYLNGPKYQSVLYNLVMELRSKTKYSSETGSWEEAYDLILELLNEYNVDVY